MILPDLIRRDRVTGGLDRSDAAQATPTRKLVEMASLVAALGVAFLIVNVIHFRLIVVDVILYACIVDAIIGLVLVCGAYLLLRYRTSPLLNTELILVIVACNLAILVYAIMGPTVIDRSLSLYIVEKLDQRGGMIAQATFKDLIHEEFMEEFQVVDVRLTEQVASGTARIDDGCVILTRKGEALADFLRFYRATLLPRKRNLLGDVTDRLTRPLEGQQAVVDTTCPQYL